MVVLAHVGAGSLEPLQLLAPLAVAGLYLKRARTLARRGRPVGSARKVSFLAGIALMLIAFSPPADHLSDELFTAHMSQHLLAADLGALLVALGLTGPLLGPLLALPGLGRLRGLAHPAVALPLWLVNLVAWHMPFAYEAALESGAVHAAEHAAFVGFGVAMWMALLGPLPSPAWFGNGARLVYVIVVRLAGAALSNVFIWAGDPFYRHYETGGGALGMTPAADQGIAGVVMMIEGSLLTLGLFAWIFLRAAREAEEREGLLALAESRGVGLDPARAERAVAAGEGSRLRERIAGGEDAR